MSVDLSNLFEDAPPPSSLKPPSKIKQLIVSNQQTKKSSKSKKRKHQDNEINNDNSSDDDNDNNSDEEKIKNELSAEQKAEMQAQRMRDKAERDKRSLFVGNVVRKIIDSLFSLLIFNILF
jgi:hypothetical protein